MWLTVEFQEAATGPGLADDSEPVGADRRALSDLARRGMAEQREMRMLHRLEQSLGLFCPREAEAAVHGADDQVELAEHVGLFRAINDLDKIWKKIDKLRALLAAGREPLIYRALLETSTSEHAARMSAMDNATKACNDMIDNLTLAYNKARQAAITADLMDIVGGAEALKG